MQTEQITQQIAIDFLKLDRATLPRAQWQDPYSLSAKNSLNPWARVRALAAGEDTTVFCGNTVWISADSDGWRGMEI